MEPWLVTLLVLGAVLGIVLAAVLGVVLGRSLGRAAGRLDAIRALLEMKNPEAWSFAHCLFVDYEAKTGAIMRNEKDAALEPRKETRRDRQAHQ